MDVAHEPGGGLAALCGNIQRLAAHQLLGAGGVTQTAHRFHDARRGHAVVCEARQLLERERQQRVAREHAQRLAELPVRRQPAAPVVVVVHGGQVVVDQRERVRALDRHGSGQRARPRSSHRLARGQREQRPHPLARRERGVAERLAQPAGPCRTLAQSPRQPPLERVAQGLDAGCPRVGPRGHQSGSVAGPAPAPAPALSTSRSIRFSDSSSTCVSRRERRMPSS